jgi:hypothetical protein
MDNGDKLNYFNSQFTLEKTGNRQSKLKAQSKKPKANTAMISRFWLSAFSLGLAACL